MIAIRSTKFLTRVLGRLGIKACQNHYIAEASWGDRGGPRISYGMNMSTIEDFYYRRHRDGKKEENN